MEHYIILKYPQHLVLFYKYINVGASVSLIASSVRYNR